MATATVDEKTLEDLVERAVQKHLDLTFQDMEKVRQSPAASIIRIEGRLDAIEARLDRDMVTRADFNKGFGNLRTELKDEMGNLRTELKDEMGNLRTEFKDEMGNLRTELKDEMGNLRTELKDEMGNLRTELKDEMGNLRTELKGEIWKLRLYIILLGVLIVLTNPKVLELLGKLLRIMTP